MNFTKLMSMWNASEIHTLRWFEERGCTQAQAYRSYKAGDIRKVGAGAYARPYDSLHWSGAVRAIQKELNLSIHISGASALELGGSGHNISFRPVIELINYGTQRLPRWVLTNDWGAPIQYRNSRMFGGSVDGVSHDRLDSAQSWLETTKVSGLEVIKSSRELAIFEVIDQSSFEQDFETVENLLSGLRSMRSSLVQQILENCDSVKVKRIFLYLSEKLEMPYFKKLKLDHVDLGSGKREIIRGGKWNAKYRITVERSSVENPF